MFSELEAKLRADADPVESDSRMMVRAARLYYEEGQMQATVAAQLGISRPTVSRLLARAREQGIVEIRIHDPESAEAQLSEGLRERLNLEDVVVVPGLATSPELLRRRLGAAAARYLRETLTANDILGVGWGRTLINVASASTVLPDGLRLVPLLGGMGQVSPSFQVHEITRRFAECGNIAWGALYVPAVVDELEAHRALMRSRDVRKVSAEWHALTAAIVGIGDIDLDGDVRNLFDDYLNDDSRAAMRRAGAIGDVCMRFFTVDGRPVTEAIPGVIGIDTRTIVHTPRVIGVAGGVSKVQAIIGAARGGYIKVLITDETTARSILSKD
jgi:deoxyribonucleoside regulator